jgi:hypothetical protein
VSAQENKAIARRLLEEPWTNLDDRYVGHDPSLPELLRGPQGFKDNVLDLPRFRGVRLMLSS